MPSLPDSAAFEFVTTIQRTQTPRLFGFWFLGFGFWVLGFGFWVLGFGFWVLEKPIKKLYLQDVFY
jgi:hypothetical protein